MLFPRNSVLLPNELELLAAGATSVPKVVIPTPLTSEASLSTPVPYNPTAVRVIMKILDLGFVQMSHRCMAG